jgi:hypothetical protein
MAACFEITSDAIFASDDPTNTRKSIPPPLLHWPLTAFGLGQSRLGVIEMEGGVVHILNMKTGVWQTHQLTAPEIQSDDRPPSTADGTVSPAIFSVAIDRSTRNIYVAISPYSVIEGASILVFTERGVSCTDCGVPFRNLVPSESAGILMDIFL